MAELASLKEANNVHMASVAGHAQQAHADHEQVMEQAAQARLEVGQGHVLSRSRIKAIS